MYKLLGRFGASEIALAISFGFLLGMLLPTSGKLLFGLVLILFLFSRANLIIGMLIMVAVSFVSIRIDPMLCHGIGDSILTNQVVQVIGGILFKIPVAAWTMLDNTVVCGSFAVGLVFFVPIFIVAWVPLRLLLPKPKESAKKKSADNN
ncbi:MAG: hypothetical protein LBQ66_16965, partial [Planctomycetaceae bacterium]|nr:hypothetical protein [Planctomycetaceae bacterium]